MENFPHQNVLSGVPGPATFPNPGVDAHPTTHIPTYENVMRLVADEDTFLLARLGLRQAWPDLELPSSHHDTELPSNHHDCTQVMVPNGGPAPKSPARAGSNGCGNKPGRTTVPRPLKCRDAGCTRWGLPVAMHRLRCGHHICRWCLTRRATGNVAISPGLQRLLAATSEALYDPGSEQYARTRQEKEALLTRIWERLRWTCCRRIVPFGEFIHRGCLSPQDAEAWVQMSAAVLRTIEGEGNRRLLRVLDDVMRLEIRFGEEVAVSTLPDLNLVLSNPFRSTPANPAGSGEGMPRLLAQRAQLHAEMTNWALVPSVLPPEMVVPAVPMAMADEHQIAMANGVPPDTGSHWAHFGVSARRLYDGHPCDMSDGHPFAIDNGGRSSADGSSSDGADWGSDGPGWLADAFGSACSKHGIRASR